MLHLVRTQARNCWHFPVVCSSILGMNQTIRTPSYRCTRCFAHPFGVMQAIVLLACTLVLPARVAGRSVKAREAQQACRGPQAAASVGLFLGESPLNLRPMELYGLEGRAAWPVANPAVLGAAGPVATPFLFSTPHNVLYMFYAQFNCSTGHSVIAVSQSNNGGASWRALGEVLAEPFSLASPFVFQDNHTGEVFMVPDTSASKQPGVLAYRAEQFPRRWVRHATLVEGVTLSGVSIAVTGKPGSRKRSPLTWTLLGALPGDGLEGEAGRLAVYRSAAGPGGPYEQHPASPVAVEGATPVGRLFVKSKGLYRFGRSCPGGSAAGAGGSYAGCGPLSAFQMVITEESIEQDTVAHSFGRRLWRQDAAWDSAGHSYLDVLETKPGSWVAAVVGERLSYAAPAIAAQLGILVRLLQLAACASATLLALAVCTYVPALHQLLFKSRAGRQLLRRLLAAQQQLSPRLLHRKPPVVQTIHVDATAARLSSSSSTHGSSAALWHARRMEAAAAADSTRLHGMPPPPPRLLRVPPWRTLVVAAVALLTVSGAGGAGFLQRMLTPYWQPALPVPVYKQHSKFTLMVMSYTPRLPALKRYIQHYSHCPSVGEILVVWNKGPPPDPSKEFDSRVPVRVRVESSNSMNNRYRPDPHLHFRGVLSLDDDIMMPCTTIEAAFAEWRRDPRQMVGFYPRLIEPEPAGGTAGPRQDGMLAPSSEGGSSSAPHQQQQQLVFRGERYSIEKGEYNVVLSGAAFIDSWTAFPAYWAPQTAPARALVDKLLNCDDLLLNFVLANATSAEAQGLAPAWPGEAAGGAQEAQERRQQHEQQGTRRQAVRWVRPERRIDVSKLTGVGISHDFTKFKQSADSCLVEFVALFGGNPLQRQRFQWTNRVRPPTCTALLGCTY